MRPCWAACRCLLTYPSATCLGCTTAMTDRTTLASSGMAIANYRPVKKPRNTLHFTSRMGTPLHPPCVTIHTADAHLRRESLLAKQSAQGS